MVERGDRGFTLIEVVVVTRADGARLPRNRVRDHDRAPGHADNRLRYQRRPIGAGTHGLVPERRRIGAGFGGGRSAQTGEPQLLGRDRRWRKPRRDSMDRHRPNDHHVRRRLPTRARRRQPVGAPLRVLRFGSRPVRRDDRTEADRSARRSERRQATPTFDRITLELESLDGSAIDIEATPRNPADTLPPASVAGDDPRAVRLPVEFDHDEYPPPPDPPSALNPSDKLLFGITLGMDVNGANCGVLTVRFSTGVTGTPRSVR